VHRRAVRPCNAAPTDGAIGPAIPKRIRPPGHRTHRPAPTRRRPPRLPQAGATRGTPAWPSVKLPSSPSPATIPSRDQAPPGPGACRKCCRSPLPCSGPLHPLMGFSPRRDPGTGGPAARLQQAAAPGAQDPPPPGRPAPGAAGRTLFGPRVLYYCCRFQDRGPAPSVAQRGAGSMSRSLPTHDRLVVTCQKPARRQTDRPTCWSTPPG